MLDISFPTGERGRGRGEWGEGRGAMVIYRKRLEALIAIP